MLLKRFVPVIGLAILFGIKAVFGANSLSVGSASGAPGSAVVVEITASTDVDILGAGFDLLFDPGKLQVKTLSENGVAKGADASSLSFVDLSETSVTSANTSGRLSLAILDLSVSSPVAAGSVKRLVAVTFSVLPNASGSIPLTLDKATLSNTSGQDLALTVNNGSVIAQADSTTTNKLWIKDATGAAGGSSTVKVLLSVDQDVYGAQFDLLFDQAKLQIKPLSQQGVAVGANGSPLTLPVIDEDAVTAANSAGKLVVMMLDLELKPMTAGENKELLAVTFMIDEAAAEGDIPLSLANVSLATVVDTLALEIEVTAEAGKITVGAFAPGDVNGDGKINIFDMLSLLQVLGGSGTVAGDPDVNADGKINIFDLLALLKLLAG